MNEAFSVVVPCYGLAGARARAAELVLAHLNELGAPVYQVVQADSRANARNIGARVSSTPALVFNDADTIVPHEQICAAVELALEAPGLVYAWDLYVRRDRDGRDAETLYACPSMGCSAISAAELAAVGGFDESFLGWGFEDVEFARRAGERHLIRRVSGPAFHLWHGERRADGSPLDEDPELVAANLERLAG